MSMFVAAKAMFRSQASGKGISGALGPLSLSPKKTGKRDVAGKSAILEMGKSVAKKMFWRAFLWVLPWAILIFIAIIAAIVIGEKIGLL